MNNENESGDSDPTLPANEEAQASDANAPPKRWVKGMESPNKNGRPPICRTAKDIRDLARDRSGAMLQFLSNTALNAKVPINARVQAATEVLNRAWGRPNQSMEINHGIANDLAALLEEIDGRNKIKIIQGTVIRPSLAIGESVLHNGQEREEDSIPAQLGTGESSE